jgi:carboxyl-terminal processing protease
VLVDESEDGNIFAMLRTREADLNKHLGTGQAAEAADPARQRLREEAIRRAEEESRKPAAEQRSRIPEFGNLQKDFQLNQALNHLRGRPVLVSKTQVIENKDEKKEN